MVESWKCRRTELKRVRAMATRPGIIILVLVIFSLPCEAQRIQKTSQAQKRQALNQALAYRHVHLREVPVDACTVWRVLGEDSSAVIPMYRPLLRGDAGIECQEVSGQPMFKLRLIETVGAQVVLTASIHQSGEEFTEVHVFGLLPSPDGSPAFFHDKVEQFDFVSAPYLPRGPVTPSSGGAKPPPRGSEPQGEAPRSDRGRGQLL